MDWTLLSPMALGRKLTLSRWLKAAKQLAEVVMSSRRAQYTPFCTVGWESDLPVMGCLCTCYELWEGLHVPFGGAREREGLCTVWPGSEASPWDKVVWWQCTCPPPTVPPSQGLPVSGGKYAWAPLPQTYFWGLSRGETPLIWVNAASCILQTTIVKYVTYLCVPPETSQVPSRTWEKSLPPWIICATNPQQTLL